MTKIWCLSPILGFFLAPLMGSLSDRCTFVWGRRRPLILLLSLLIFTGLILVPWGKQIGLFIEGDAVGINQTIAKSNESYFNHTVQSTDSGNKPHLYIWAAVITVIGMIFLDFSADTCQTPARTYLLDVCISGNY